MKRCPNCNRSFDDESLSFCLEDGTPLVPDFGGRGDSQATLVSPMPFPAMDASINLPPAQTVNQLPGKPTINVSGFNAGPQQAYVPALKQPSKLPWVLGIGAIVLLLIGGIVVAAIFVPPMMKGTANANRAVPTPSPDRNGAPPANASPAVADDIPTDEDEVLAQLTKLEDEWAGASVKGDKAVLERILADEYSGGAEAPSKRGYIDSLSADPSIKSWEIHDLAVDQNADRATVTGNMTLQTTKGKQSYDFTDKYVWRDHRWQAVSSQTGDVK